MDVRRSNGNKSKKSFMSTLQDGMEEPARTLESVASTPLARHVSFSLVGLRDEES